MGLFFLILGFSVGITKTEWMFQLLAMGGLLASESLNTAVEKLCDFVHPDFHDKIGEIKDVSAGAVTFAAFFGTATSCVIYIPYLLDFLGISL